MKELDQAVSVAGKEKVMRELCFENVPVQALQQGECLAGLLANWADQTALTPKMILENSPSLAPYKKAVGSLSDLVTCSDRVDRLFWNVVQAFPGKVLKEQSETDAQKQVQQKRLKLRADVLTLFDLFQSLRGDLKSHSTNYQILAQVFKGVSEKVHLAHLKGYVSQADLAELNKELAIIDQVLQNVKKQSIICPSKLSLKPEVIKGLFLKDLPLKSREEISEASLQTALLAHRESGRRPASQPVQIPGLTAIPLNFYKNIQTKEDFIQTFRRLLDRVNQPNLTETEQKLARQEISRFFIEVPYQPFASAQVKNNGSFWWNFSKEESHEIMEKINQYTETLVKAKKSFCGGQYELESYIQMWRVLEFLNATATGKWLRTCASYNMEGFIGYYAHFNPWFNRFIRQTNHDHLLEDLGFSMEPFFEKIDSNSDWTSFKSQTGESVPLSEEEYKYVKKQRELIGQFFKEDHFSQYKVEKLINSSSWDRWIRPLFHPGLKALYRLAISSPCDSARRNETGGRGEGRNTPEAFHDNPEGVFNFFQQENNPENVSQQSLPFADSFTLEEKKRLLRLVRSEEPQIELMAFLREMPHLMRNQDVRSFFDALFFSSSLEDFLKDRARHLFLENLPAQIEDEIQRLQRQVNEALNEERIADVETFQGRFEALLYLYEMKEKLRRCYPVFNRSAAAFTSSKNELTQLRQLCQNRSELQGCLGYAARVHLKALFADHVEADISEMVKDYALSRSYLTDSRNIDPYFEDEMMRHWQVIAKKCEETQPNLNSFLDLLCYQKDLPLDNTEWQRREDGFYCNNTYQVNLYTLEVSKIGMEGGIENLPLSIAQNPLFQKMLGGLVTDLRTTVKEAGTKKIYSLQDKVGRPIQIELEAEKLTFYTKLPIEGGKWVQILQDNPFDPENLQKVKSPVNAGANPIGFRAIFKAFSELEKQAEEQDLAVSAFAHYRIYMDPSNPASFYCLDQKGDAAFQLNVKQTPEGIVIENVKDYRTSPTSHWQVNQASLMQNEAIEALACFENKSNMLLWSQGGKLQKIELPRYNLTFAFQQGRLVCTEGSFKDYFIDLSASLKEKKGFFHALMLQHSDPIKPKKLLIPEAEAITSKHQLAFPQASGLAKIPYFFEKIITIISALLGKPFKLNLKLRFEMDPKRGTLGYNCFDIRPFTGEICRKRENWESEALQLVKLALKTDQPELAWEMLNHIELKPESLSNEAIKKIVAFIQKPMLSNGPEAALKIKFGLKLKLCLKQKKHWKEKVKKIINEELLKQGQVLFAHGRKVPNELQLTKAERIQLARLFKKHLPGYFEKHLKLYFVAEGTTINLSESIPEEADNAFAAQVAEWKAERPPVDITGRINALETILAPSTCLRDEDLSRPIPRAAEPVSLLDFSQAEEKRLFEAKEQNLPSIDLMAYQANTSCERRALEETQAAINQFKSAEQGRPVHRIKANKKELKQFLENKWIPKKVAYEQQVKDYQVQIEALIHQSQKGEEQLAIFANRQSIACLDELRYALAMNQLEDLQRNGRLPSTLNITELKSKLISYFDVLSRRNAYEAAIKLTQEILARGRSEDQEEWSEMSEALYRLLKIQRSYDPSQEPRLLIFEAQQFINLKPLDGGLDQLALLDSLVKNPYGIIQAPTGAGKTAVLSVMRSLLKATGKNLVIQKVLPPLFQQTYDKFKNVLGDLYGTAIYPLRFNLKMRLSKQEVVRAPNERGILEDKIIEHSIFKEMYHDLLEIIKNKGCVLTDYKSLPLIEEMFFKTGQDLMEARAQGLPLSPLKEEHFNYLRKILILLENKADENMDEFDQPNRPIQKIQLDLGVGGRLLPSFLYEHSLEIYDHLVQDPELDLLKNLQSDISVEMRSNAIDRAAQKMARKLAEEADDLGLEADIKNYIQGRNEDLLPRIQSQPTAYKDRLAVCKDQFSIYLPLTLKFKEGSRYARSEDGSKTLPCYNGDKHDAKFGTILEQINYTIQDYLQKGITSYDLKPWINEIKHRWEEEDDAQRKAAILAEFHLILPGFSIVDAALAARTEQGAKPLIDQINQDQAKIKTFLLARLRLIKTSGSLISMDPQNNIDMSRVVSAVSATMGSPDSLHRQFQVNSQMNGQIQANMIYRLKKRAEQEEVIAYDPEFPASMFGGDRQRVHAVIDGAGAFKDGVQAAELLRSRSTNLEQVGYHKEDESIAFAGNPTGDLAKTGFFFSQSHTRGTDIPLASDAKAILTLNQGDGIREYFQKEGRLRQGGQRYKLAISKYQNINGVTQEIAHAIKQDALVDAQDIFRKCKQEARAIVRKSMRTRLLHSENLDGFIALFQNEEWRSYFISKPESNFEVAGSYFNERQHIQREDQRPGDVLNAYKAILVQKAQEWGLHDVVEKLNQVQYSEELLAKMPDQVAPLGSAQGELETEVHVEQEEESEQEQELELETQQEQVRVENRALGVYPIRPYNYANLFHQVADKINPAYHPLIKVTDAFLPFSREGTLALYKRKPFDESMFRIGTVYFQVDDFFSREISRVIIDDPLKDYRMTIGSWIYDIRTNRFIQHGTYSTIDISRSAQFEPIIAQVKFLDGRTSGYTQGELAALANWLRTNNPARMKEHLLNEILRYRYQDKQAFVGSQLHQLFETLAQ